MTRWKPHGLAWVEGLKAKNKHGWLVDDRIDETRMPFLGGGGASSNQISGHTHTHTMIRQSQPSSATHTHFPTPA